MKLYSSIIFATATLAFSIKAHAQAELIEIPLSDPAQPAAIEIDVLHGSIHVVGEDRETIALEITGGNNSERRIVTPSGTKPIPLNNYAIDAEESDNRVRISSGWKSKGMTIRARVPRESDLDLSAIHGGSIKVDSIAGRLELSNIHGGIVARAVSGTVVAETVHGAIEVELDEVRFDTPMAFTAVHGDIDLFLPVDLGASITIDSRQNEIVSDFEVEFLPSNPKINRGRTRHGTKFELQQALEIAINGGGTPIRIETLHGGVSLHKVR